MTFECASWLGRRSCPGLGSSVLMGAGAAGEGSAGEVAVEAGTLAVGVNRLMRLVCLPLAVVGFPKSLGWLRGRGEPSMNGVPNLPGCEVGLLANARRRCFADRLRTVRHQVRWCRWDFPVEGLGNRRLRPRSEGSLIWR